MIALCRLVELFPSSSTLKEYLFDSVHHCCINQGRSCLTKPFKLTYALNKYVLNFTYPT
jgi:hypothetical protein